MGQRMNIGKLWLDGKCSSPDLIRRPVSGRRESFISRYAGRRLEATAKKSRLKAGI